MTASAEWLGVEELAEWLDVPVRTVYAWRHKGLAPRGATFGRHVRFRRADVEIWIAEQYDEPRKVS